MSRIAKCFARLESLDRAAFIPFITAGDPDAETSFSILEKLPIIGADIIELGMPFSDPMADGPAVQASSLRALQAGMTLPKTLDLVRRFRKRDATTPIVLMGYYNPIHHYGTARFAKDAAQAGIDGLIIVDLPPEEDDVLRVPAASHGIDIVRLATPTTDSKRLLTILNGARGFLYYVSITGVTGTKTFSTEIVRAAVANLKADAHIPCAVGFGIRTPEQAAEIARFADGAAVGSAIVSLVAEGKKEGLTKSQLVENIVNFCETLAKSVHAARRPPVID